MFDFILNGAGRFEQLKRSQLDIASGEIESTFNDDWRKTDVAVRCHEAVAVPLKEQLDSGAQPELLAKVEIVDREKQFRRVEFGDVSESEEMLHFLQVGDQVFMIGAAERGHRRTELRVFEPIDAADFNLERAEVGDIKAVYGEKLGKLDSIRLYRNNPPTTAVQFGKGKIYDDESYGWALFETVTSALRRGRTNKLRAMGELDTVELGTGGRTTSKPLRFDELLSLIETGTGTMTPDGPPAGHDLLSVLPWRDRTVALTRERGDPPRVRAFIRDKVGDQPVWMELRFPRGADIPAGGVAAAIRGSTLRIFGGVDKNGEALSSEWQIDLAAGAGDAYATAELTQGPDLPDPVAWATALGGDKRTVLAGGVAGFYQDRNQPDATPAARAIRAVIQQGKRDGASWRLRREHPKELIGSTPTTTEDGVFFAPGATFDGRVFYTDDQVGAVELPELPSRLGLGQLHVAGNLLIYTGGFSAGAPAKANATVYTLDLEQLDGWQARGDVPMLAGTNRVVEQDGRLVVMGVTPKGRFTFVPGTPEESA